MTDVFVAEIGGRAMIALNADGEAAARAVLDEPAVRFDLQSFQCDGVALWNGVDEIHLRPPAADEQALWEASFREALAASGSAYEEAIRETWICVLVAVSAPAG